MRKNDVVISCQNVWKVFGPHPGPTLGLAMSGASKQQILEKNGNVVAVKNASFDVRENEIFVIMGLSGSGKSTLARCINRLAEPTKGKILIEGEDITRMGRAELRQLRRNKISMVFQNFGLLPHRSVLDNIAFGLEIRGEKKKERLKKAARTLEQMGLAGYGDRRLSDLSGGMQQRVGLARSLVMGSEIVLMDEPFSALDPLIRRQMQDEFIRLRATMKKTVIFITHDLVEALKLGDRIAIMKDGEIIQTGTPHEIVSQPSDAYVREFVKDAPRGKVLTANSIMEEPRSAIWSQLDVETAIRDMAANESGVCFVIDNQGVLEGIVTMNQAVSAAKNGQVTLDTITNREFAWVFHNSPIEESLRFIGDSDTPVAVLDESRHLLGVITRKRLIRALLRPDELARKDAEA